MLDQISKLIEQVGAKEAGASGIPSDLMSKVTGETKDTIVSGFKSAVTGGNLNQVTDLFKGSSSVSAISSNPLVSGMITNLISKLTGSLGMDSNVSKGFATAAIPQILSTLISKSKDSDSGFNPADLLSSLGGGDAGGMLGKLGGLAGMLGGSGKGKSSGSDPLFAIKGLFK